MKTLKLNILQKFIFLFSTLLIVVGCSDNSESLIQPEEVVVENERDLFIQSLNNFNQDYQSTVIDVQITDDINTFRQCGFWCKAGKVVAVAGADIVGAGAGAKAVQGVAIGVGAATGGTGYAVVTGAAAVITGAGTSIIAAKKINAVTQSPEHRQFGAVSDNFGKNLVYGRLDINYPSKYGDLKNIGRLHNKRLHQEYSNFIGFSASSDDKAYDILNSREFLNINLEIQESIEEYVNNDFNIFELTKDLNSKEIISQDMESVLNIFFEIYNNIKSTDNITDIVNFYIDAISNTDILEEDDKAALIASFSTASESPSFWLNQN